MHTNLEVHTNICSYFTCTCIYRNACNKNLHSPNYIRKYIVHLQTQTDIPYTCFHTSFITQNKFTHCTLGYRLHEATFPNKFYIHAIQMLLKTKCMSNQFRPLSFPICHSSQYTTHKNTSTHSQTHI